MQKYYPQPHPLSVPNNSPQAINNHQINTSLNNHIGNIYSDGREERQRQWNFDPEASHLVGFAALKQVKLAISRAFVFASSRISLLDKNEDYERVRDPRVELKYLQLAYLKKEEGLKSNEDKKEKQDKARMAAMEQAHKQTNQAALEAIRFGRSQMSRSSSNTNLQVFPVSRTRSAPSVRIIERDLLSAMSSDPQMKYSRTHNRLLFAVFTKKSK